MARRHLPWGWSCGGRSGPKSAAAACLVPCPLVPSGLTTSLLSAGLFKMSSMEKDRPCFFGASHNPELFLSISRGDQSPPWHPPRAAARGQRGQCPWRGPCFPETPGIKRVSRGEQRFSRWIIQHGYVSMGTSVGHLKTPWDQGCCSCRESWKGLYPCPRA